MKFYLLSAILALHSFAFAEGEITLQEPYQSGSEIYAEVLKDPSKIYVGSAADIEGKFLEVPLDYNNPQAGKMKIYYRTSPGFKPSLPTVFYFYGGPGGNSWYAHFEKFIPGVNFIYMDQRGTGFSKPERFEDLKNTDYFTSEFITRDADLVRTALGVDKLTAYGQSYGTVLAQIYANLFSAHTNTLIIEGVVYNGEEPLWSNPHRLKLLNRFFAQLPKEQRQKFLDFTARPDVPDEWLGKLAQQAMYMPHFEESLLKRANDFVDEYDKKDQQPDFNLLTSESKYWGAYMFNHIACKELSRNAPHANFSSTLTPEGKFIPYADNGYKTCKTLTSFDESKIKTYYATHYPVNVPTTYFQGTEDGATSAVAAIAHYKNAAKGNAQMILITHEGHGPMINRLMPFEHNATCPPQYVDLFKSAIQGQLITKAQLDAATTAKNKWVQAKRWNN